MKGREDMSGTLAHIERLFRYHRQELRGLRELALAVSGSIEDINAFIQQGTEAVCPSCEKVCCINIHSYHEYEDIVYILALGDEVPSYKQGVADSAPCHFLGKRGCTISRFLRPYRCNWYFCTPLLEHLTACPASAYRGFIASLEELTRKRE